ncbi:MAG: DUF1593 domain-containing protein [Catalinimonas sp.]
MFFRCFLLFVSLGAAAQPADSTAARVIVSTDIGGSDPDDFQSMVHLLLYADTLDIEGLISSPPGTGRKSHLLEALDAYAQDYPALRRHGSYPTPDALRTICFQGDTAAQEGPVPLGLSEGAQHLIFRARHPDPRPLYVLVWGSITDVAQAVHHDPLVKDNLRVYSIGSWNTQQDSLARQYLYDEHPDLWWIENDDTFRGIYEGGEQAGDRGNRTFVAAHVAGHGALGNLFVTQKDDLKMGDTPSVFYLLRGDPNDPTGESWGGQFCAAPDRPHYWTDCPAPELREGNHPGARTVNRWRTAYLDDWRRRMDRVLVR